ncbi:MAG TPA: hypothetical protein V6C71_09355 [Coleofasciculaceae cyanobacterium]|jgi:hypothetical protein
MDEISQIISNVEQTKGYLTQQAKAEPAYWELIKTLNIAVAKLKTASKPVVKIVSPSATLANNLQAKNQANVKLRSLYEFQAVAPITNLRRIVQNCDLICLIYYFEHNIVKHHQRLIELARQENISLVLLVKQPKKHTQGASLSNWLTAQNYTLEERVQLPLNNFIDLNNYQQIGIYQQLLVDLSELAMDRLTARSKQTAKATIEHFINHKIKDARQEVKYLKSRYLQNLQPSCYQQQFRQNINQLNKLKQQIIKAIQLDINHSKADLLNPFLGNSLISRVQEMIYTSQTKIVKEAEDTYIYLTLANSFKAEYIHNYIIELCQQKVDELMIWQWSQINYVYAEGGLQALIAKINAQLNIISPLLTSEIELPVLAIPEKYPSLNLEQIIDSNCLKFNSRISFDYHFTQSSWFRLVISLLAGLAIYLLTWIYFGNGQYIGFAILFFQIINLITGQNIKTAKLKQHSKELKRIVDRNYQNLIRLVIDQSVQKLIVALERESQLYEKELEKAIAIAHIRLEQLKDTIAQHKLKIASLEQDRSKILSWFD